MYKEKDVLLADKTLLILLLLRGGENVEESYGREVFLKPEIS